MRGKIIQYNGADGSGTVVVEGRQCRFALASWRGDNAPALNKVVEVALDGETVVSVTAVPDEVLLREKASELGGKLGALWQKIPTPAPSTGESDGATGIAAGALVERYGKLVLGAHVAFLLGTLVFNAITISMMGQGLGKSLFDIASLMGQFGGGGGGGIKLLLLLAYASIAVPALWHDRRAWLALALPLIALAWAIFSTLHAIESLGGGGMAGQFADAFDLGLGFYLSLAAALVLAVAGAKRWLVAR